MQGLSVIIPTLDAGAALKGCIGSLGLVGQVIVSDGGSKDATPEIAERLGAHVITGKLGRGGQLRRGAAAATGEWLLFLHADSRFPPGWLAVVQNHVEHRGGPAVFRLRFDAAGVAPRIVAGWANLRSRAGLPYGDQGLLISRADYDRIGGYADIPLMEDVEILGRLGTRPRLLACTVTTSAEKYLRQGWLRRGARNLWTLARWYRGVRPEVLARDYSA